MIELIKPSYRIESSPVDPCKTLERIGRTCYKSKDRITDGSAEEFCRMILKRGHLSVFEHVSFTVRFIVDRGVSHELVRHRLAAYSQESTRYCSYHGGVAFIVPPWVNIEPGKYDNECPYHVSDTDWSKADQEWFGAMAEAAISYKTLTREGWTPQQARSVLPNSLKTEIVATMNLRQWRHVLELRTAPSAHPQMREVMVPLLEELQSLYPVLFEGIGK